jgi:hypothetical protein
MATVQPSFIGQGTINGTSMLFCGKSIYGQLYVYGNTGEQELHYQRNYPSGRLRKNPP